MVLIPKQESVSLVTTQTAAITVTPESGLVLEGNTMTPTRVETRLHIPQIMATSTSRPWDTSWSSKKELNLHERQMDVQKIQLLVFYLNS